MKLSSMLVVPLVFCAGMVAIVSMQYAGILQVNKGNDIAVKDFTNNAAVQGATLETDAITSKRSNAAAVKSGSTQSSELTDQSEALNNLSDEVKKLKKQLQEATRQRDTLQLDIKELGEAFENAVLNNTIGGSDANENEFLPSGEGVNPLGAESNGSPEQARTNFEGRGDRRRGFGPMGGDELYQSLVSAGIDQGIANEIKQRSDQWSLARLDLIDQASREGWRQSDQFEERMRELREERPDVRSELGDAEYDQYLYSSGASNRVQISSVIDGSAAQLSGMQVQDVVRSYANQRIFNGRELQRATRDGSRGELVFVSIERNGQLLSLEIPRGPLGVSLSEMRVEPDGL